MCGNNSKHMFIRLMRQSSGVYWQALALAQLDSAIPDLDQASGPSKTPAPGSKESKGLLKHTCKNGAAKMTLIASNVPIPVHDRFFYKFFRRTRSGQILERNKFATAYPTCIRDSWPKQTQESLKNGSR